MAIVDFSAASHTLRLHLIDMWQGSTATLLVAEQGRIGRSQGCFALSEADLAQIMARLGAGRLLFADRL
jgi:L,D-transpeptidase catalytic domain